MVRGPAGKLFAIRPAVDEGFGAIHRLRYEELMASSLIPRAASEKHNLKGKLMRDDSCVVDKGPKQKSGEGDVSGPTCCKGNQASKTKPLVVASDVHDAF